MSHETRSPAGCPVFAAAFAPDALVHDEGATHRGPDEIVAWWAANTKYGHRAEPLDVTKAGGKLLVLPQVSGVFPAALRY